MSALSRFETNIAAADQLVTMYRELRKTRNLGARGRLSAANHDLLWLPRSSVVAAISALDTYVHDVLNERILVLVSTHAVPDPLADALASVFQVKHGKDIKSELKLLSSHTSLLDLCSRLREEKLEFASYQAPEKIEGAYKLIGTADVFSEVAGIWQGPRSTAEDIKRSLASYVKRRNQIAHEGDCEQNGAPRSMQPEYAVSCKVFVESLVTRLNRVVYGI